MLTPGRALDIACGFGRHAIWLHEHGWRVTAVDRNAEAIAGIKGACPEIDARVVDLESSLPEVESGSYDLVVCWLYFQRELFPFIREAVRPGGLVVTCALMQGRFAAQPGELRNYFPDWKVVSEVQSERTTELVVQRHL